MRIHRPHGAPRRRARLLAGATATAVLTAGLLAVAAPADADVLDPSGRAIHTTAMCDTGTQTFSLMATPQISAVARVTAYALETGFTWSVDLYPTYTGDISYYEYRTATSGRFSLHVEYWWQDAAGNWLTAGEWVPEYIDAQGQEQVECRV
jgi:hypothetical protein